MAYTGAKTSIHGRKLELETVSSVQTGGAHGETAFLTGDMRGVRALVTTANTTSTNVRPYGVQFLPSSSVASSQVYTLDPPIPGVGVTIVNSTAGTCYLRMNASSTMSGITLTSSQGPVDTTIKASSKGGAHQLIGVTTAKWMAFGLTSGTSSNSGTFLARTTS